MLYWCVRYLHRHPSEVDLSMDEMADVAAVAWAMERQRVEELKAIIETIAARPSL